MIRFACIYCGYPVSAEEELAGRKIECPACGHFVRVRPHQPGDALKTSGDDSNRHGATDIDHWQDKSNEEIMEWVRSQTRSKAAQRLEAAKRSCGPVLPHYDDLTLFALSMTFMLLSVLNADLRGELMLVFAAGNIGFETILLAMAALGMVLSFVNALLKREKSDFEKVMMLFFALIVTTGTSLYAGNIVLQMHGNWLIVFPAWNGIHAILLFVLAGFGILDTDCITDEPTSLSEMGVAVASIAILLVVCQFVFRLHWVVAYSVAICYTMSLLRTVRGVLRRTRQGAT